MKKYALTKLIGMFFTINCVAFLVFLSFAVIPGDPALAKLGAQATPERLAAMRAQMGLDRPFWERFFSWLLCAIRGDFGTSYSYGTSVSAIIAEKLPVTLLLTGMSFIIMVTCSIPISIYTAKHEGGRIDRREPMFLSGRIL